MTTQQPKCRECGHTFSRSDRRGWINRDEIENSCCPLCSAMSFGSHAWAIANDCNGVFDTEVYATKAAAEAECAKPEWQSAGCAVVPVIVLRDERGDAEWRRDFEEKQRNCPPDIDRRRP